MHFLLIIISDSLPLPLTLLLCYLHPQWISFNSRMVFNLVLTPIERPDLLSFNVATYSDKQKSRFTPTCMQVRLASFNWTHCFFNVALTPFNLVLTFTHQGPAGCWLVHFSFPYQDRTDCPFQLALTCMLTTLLFAYLLAFNQLFKTPTYVALLRKMTRTGRTHVPATS